MTTATLNRKISHYQIEGLIGEGGMATVYRAVDERLGRSVALKFLHPSSSADEAMRRRFLTEARAAAALDHPNICTIYDVDEGPDGELFIAMALYTGETLDALLARGPVAPARALEIVGQAARGLSAAHEELIVHRDVKPANVMLATHDVVKMLDFGLAHLRGQPQGEAGLVSGTPAYMSPEQLRGEPVDNRTDIWSLGVVFYEMLAGKRPFTGSSLRELIASVLHAPLQPLAEMRGLPLHVDRIVGRALARRRDDRYSSIDLFADDLLRLRDEIRDDNALAAAQTERRIAVSGRRSVAVLPFADMSPTGDQEYLCEGIAEEVLGALAAVPDLRVASRSSSFRFGTKAVDVREVGSRLNVDLIVEGSVRRAGDRLRISAQLVNVDDGFRLWSDRFEGDLSDIFAIEERIARRIAEALEVTLDATAERGGTTDAAAYNLYLQGRRFFHQHRRKTFEIALQTFQGAIDIDPGYARAFAGIADCNSFLRLYFGGGSETVEAAGSASLKAIELAPDLAEALTSRGLALFLTGDYESATLFLHQAIAAGPSLYEAHYISGRVSFSRGDFAAAAQQFEKACELSPDAFDASYLLGMALRRLSKLDAARRADRACIEAVKSRVRHHPDDTRAWTMGAAVLAEMGESDRAAAWVERALAIDRDESIILYNAACVYTALNRFDEAFACLEGVLGNGAISASWMENDPDLDPLRSDSRFPRLIAASGR
jgi:serine/threonine protein kinase/tetratricopeptide (TPR) repeat protein